MAAAVRDRSPALLGTELDDVTLAGGKWWLRDLVSDGVLHGSSQELALSYQCSDIVRSKIN